MVNQSCIQIFWGIPFWKALFRAYNSYLYFIFRFWDLNALNLETLACNRSDSVSAVHLLIHPEFITYPFVTSFTILERSRNFLRVSCSVLFDLRSSWWSKMNFFQNCSVVMSIVLVIVVLYMILNAYVRNWIKLWCDHLNMNIISVYWYIYIYIYIYQ